MNGNIVPIGGLAAFLREAVALGEQKARHEAEGIVETPHGVFMRRDGKLGLIRPETLRLNSLDGLLDYWESTLKEKNSPPAYFAAAGNKAAILQEPHNNSAFSPINGLAEAFALVADLTFLGQWLEQERAIIKIKTSFQNDEAVAELLAALGALVLDEAITAADDGVSLNIMAKSGLSLGKKITLGTVALRPYETFAEVQRDAPARFYSVRVKKEGGAPLIALFASQDPSVDLRLSCMVRSYLVKGLNNRGVPVEQASKMVLI